MKNIKRSISKMAEKNPMWKGNNVGYIQLHDWVAERMPKPPICCICETKDNIDLSNKGIYDRNLENWEWLCRRCHMEKDGRLDKLKQRMGNRNKKIKRNCNFCDREFYTVPSTLKLGWGKYCSKSCSNRGR